MSKDDSSDTTATTYSLIYQFLLVHSHNKTAKRLKKDLKNAYNLNTSVEAGYPSLDAIIKLWKDSNSPTEALDKEEAACSTDSESNSSSNSSLQPVENSELELKDSAKQPQSDIVVGSGSQGVIYVDEDPLTGKKRKFSKSTLPSAPLSASEMTSGNVKTPRKSNAPFQRVKPEDAEYHDARLQDNSFSARGAHSDDYGARASHDLIVTRGAGFRKEKNKKKRGSYRGGEITLQSHSIKFT